MTYQIDFRHVLFAEVFHVISTFFFTVHCEYECPAQKLHHSVYFSVVLIFYALNAIHVHRREVIHLYRGNREAPIYLPHVALLCCVQVEQLVESVGNFVTILNFALFHSLVILMLYFKCLLFDQSQAAVMRVNYVIRQNGVVMLRQRSQKLQLSGHLIDCIVELTVACKDVGLQLGPCEYDGTCQESGNTDDRSRTHDKRKGKESS